MSTFAESRPATVARIVATFSEPVYLEPAPGTPGTLNGVVETGTELNRDELYAAITFVNEQLAELSPIPEQRWKWDVYGYVTFRGVRCHIMGPTRHNGDGTATIFCRVA